MRIILSTEDVFAAAKLKTKIIDAIKGAIDNINIETWSYVRSGDKYDVIFHNPVQYTDTPNKNVVFRIELDDERVVLSTAWWVKNGRPIEEMFCLHVGRLIEMITRYFNEDYIKIIIEKM